MVVRWGIIGAGSIAERGMGPALNRAAGTRLAAVFSRSMDKARAFAAKYQAEKAYDSLEKMLADPEVDAVYIATPNSLHASQTIVSAQAGKHVLCEKPMAITVKDGAFAFGGLGATLALLQRGLVERRRWLEQRDIGEDRQEGHGRIGAPAAASRPVGVHELRARLSVPGGTGRIGSRGPCIQLVKAKPKACTSATETTKSTENEDSGSSVAI